MIACYNALKNTSGTNEKIAILKSYDNNGMVKLALRLCYEPFLHTYIQSVPNPKAVGDRTFEEAFNDFYTLYFKLNYRTITGNAARDAIRDFLRTVRSDAQEIFVKILKKDLKVGIAEKTLNKAYGDGFVNIFEVQLGEPYDPERMYRVSDRRSDEITYWWCSRKLNGIRGYQEKDDALRTRNGNEIFGFDHILEEIMLLKKEYGLHFVDGELFDIGIPFQTIVSYVSADVNIIPEHKEKIKFNVFAVGMEDDWANTASMINLLESISWEKYKYILPLKYERVLNDPDIIYTKMNDYYEEGFEGAMLRHPFKCWSKGRSHDIVKVKPVKEGDFRVIGFERGKPDGENANSLGALLIEGSVSETVKGKSITYKIRCRCGSGFKKKPELGITRDQIWYNQNDWIDTIVEVQYQSVTDKPDKDGYYALQFPRFYRRRDDKRL